jgi:hypothetical protein
MEMKGGLVDRGVVLQGRWFKRRKRGVMLLKLLESRPALLRVHFTASLAYVTGGNNNEAAGGKHLLHPKLVLFDGLRDWRLSVQQPLLIHATWHSGLGWLYPNPCPCTCQCLSPHARGSRPGLQAPQARHSATGQATCSLLSDTSIVLIELVLVRRRQFRDWKCSALQSLKKSPC